MYLIFDTETNGLPKNYKAPMADLDNWPRVIQLAWQLYDANGTIMLEDKALIYPDGWEIPTKQTFLRKGMTSHEAEKAAQFWIDNGFTTQGNRDAGLPIVVALKSFIKAYESSQYLIAHNIAFDYKILGAELMRAGLKADVKLPKICTMEATTNICKIPGKYGKYKWPKLEQAHYKLFRKNFDGAHDAMEDVRACARVFFELRKMGVL